MNFSMIVKVIALSFLLTAGDVLATENTCQKWLNPNDFAVTFSAALVETDLKTTASEPEPFMKTIKAICEKHDDAKIINDFAEGLKKTLTCLQITDAVKFGSKIQTAVNTVCGGTFVTELMSCSFNLAAATACLPSKNLFTADKDVECKDFDAYTKCFLDIFKECNHVHTAFQAFVVSLRSELTCTAPPSKPSPGSTPAGNSSPVPKAEAEKSKSAASASSIALMTVVAGILQVVMFK